MCTSFSPDTGTSEGTDFVIALSPIGNDNYDSELIINARQTTYVSISTSFFNQVVTVYGNWSLKYELDYNMRTVDGIENKGGW